MKLKVVFVLIALFVFTSLFAAPAHAWPWDTTSTVKVTISNHNWLVITRCTGASLNGNGRSYGAAHIQQSVSGRGCTVTFNNVVNRANYSLVINAYVNRASKPNVAVGKMVYISRPTVTNTVNLGTIYFYH